MKSKQRKNKMDKPRCSWVSKDPIYIQYHDEEWGQLTHFEDDHYLFEMLTLEGAQAGLSWLTILKRREDYRAAFAQFDPAIVATYEASDIERIIKETNVIRNRMKLMSTVKNAQVVLDIQREFGTFSQYLWQFVGEKQIINEWQTEAEVPTDTALSKALSIDLKKRGCSFVGPVICYAYLQAIGLVQDHTADCFLYKK